MAEANEMDIIAKKLEWTKLQDEAPYSYPKPKQVAIYSIRPRQEGEEPAYSGGDGKSSELIEKYSVHENYHRTLSANRMVLFKESLRNPRFDLRRGYGTQIEKNKENEFLGVLLECLVKEDLVGKSEFVCRRGRLTDICSSPYEAESKFDDGLRIVVQKFKGVLYLFEFPLKQENRDARGMEMSYWGRKFESYVTAKLDQSPNPEMAMDFNYDFCPVVETKVGPHLLMFGGEVDCCLPENINCYVELKTRREFEHDGKARSFRKFKLRNWWLQSFLIGIEDIVCGIRDDDGLVKDIEWKKVSEIPHIIKQDRGTWKPEVCITFLQSFLDQVNREVTKELVPYVFTRYPCRKDFTKTIDDEGQFRFLPLWFTKRIEEVEAGRMG